MAKINCLVGQTFWFLTVVQLSSTVWLTFEAFTWLFECLKHFMFSSTTFNYSTLVCTVFKTLLKSFIVVFLYFISLALTFG